MKTKSKWLMIMAIVIFNAKFSILDSTLWEVNHDGSGDFVTIQSAVNNAADGDSILVHPGRYREKVDYLGKALSIFSKLMTTGNDEYVKQTIIDAEEKGSAVKIIESKNAYLGGLTLTGGSGGLPFPASHTTKGGGLLIIESKAVIEDCLITGNRAETGGGGKFAFSQVTFKGNTFTNNTAVFGGGIFLVSLRSTAIKKYFFDTEKKNNVFKNSGIEGNDIYGQQIPYLDIKLRKGTVTHQDPYFYYFHHSCGEISVSAETAAVDQVRSDLYVATWGSDENSGLTPGDPLKRISYALMKVKADSLKPQTIYIEEGLYSPSETGELLPLHLKPYVTLTSMTEDTRWTVDAEGKSTIANARVDVGDFTVRNAVMKGGTYAFVSIPLSIGLFNATESQGHTVILENIDLVEGHPNPMKQRYVFGVSRAKETVFNNIRVTGHPSFAGGYIQFSSFGYSGKHTATLNRLHIDNTLGGLGISSRCNTEADVTISNSLIANSNDYGSISATDGLTIIGGGINDEIDLENRRVRIINCTFAGNTFADFAVLVKNRLTTEFYNNIIYDNQHSGDSISLWGFSRTGKAHFSHNLIEDGLSGIGSVNYSFTYNNIITEDPLFLGETGHPDLHSYKPVRGSPAINAGTTNIPGYTFEKYDLAGEQRIVGDSIDLGAYEYQRITGVEDYTQETKISSYAYPNPVQMRRGGGNIRCTIRFTMPTAGDVIAAVYNAKGQRVRTLINAYTGKGSHSIHWDGTNSSGQMVSSGMYMYRIETENLAESGSIMIVK